VAIAAGFALASVVFASLVTGERASYIAMRQEYASPATLPGALQQYSEYHL